jgi:hypothetical protein
MEGFPSIPVLTTRQCSDQLKSQISDLDRLATQIVAHDRKFELANSQLRRFSEHFSTISSDTKMTIDQLASYNEFGLLLREYQEYMGEYLIHSWAHSVLENGSSTVPTDLCNFATRLRSTLQPLDREGANAFDPAVPEWLQFHIIDLRAIAASFNHHLTGISDDTHALITRKLQSLKSFLDQYETEELATGTRIFSPIPIHYQNWRLDPQDLTTERSVASGSSATVYYGCYRPTGAPVAIKQLKYSKLHGSKLLVFQREITTLATATHPTLLKFVGATDSPPFSIVTEWMPGGSLYSDLHQQHSLDPSQLTIAAIDIARGMRFLHSRQIIHRDLKSLNVLVAGDGSVRLCDFGFARKAAGQSEPMSTNVGTPYWMAPELLSGEVSYTEKVDVYGFGILLWEILTKKTPYGGVNADVAIRLVLTEDRRPTIPPDAPQPVRELIESCWARDPRARPSFRVIMRILRSGNFLLPGADLGRVVAHLEDASGGAEEEAADAVESQLDSQELTLPKFYGALVGGGVPSELTERCWENLLRIRPGATNREFVQCVALFLKTGFADKAASVLRSLQAGTVPQDVALEIASLLPTGHDSLNRDLVVTACKNGAAEAATLHSISPDDIKLGLEVLARIGVRAEHRKQMVDRCLKCLRMNEAMLATAALRCLVAMGATHEIPVPLVAGFLTARKRTVKMAAYITIAKMVDEGAELPLEIIDVFVANIDAVNVAGTVLALAARQPKTAAYIVCQLAERIPQPPLEPWMRILGIASKHGDLPAKAKAAVARLRPEEENPDVVQGLAILKQAVG